MTPGRVLIVDADPAVGSAVTRDLRATHAVHVTTDPSRGLADLLDVVPDALLCDADGTDTGADLVHAARRYLPDLAIVALTRRARVPELVELFRLGIGDFLRKPFDRGALVLSLERAAATSQTRRLLVREPTEGDALSTLIGESPPMQTVRLRCRQVASTDATVLITGESGTGKEVVARAIHALSERRHAPFVSVHCGALPKDTIDAELFGHARGAFTGADWPRAGRFEDAADGTLFLDEIGTMPESVQTRLLRVLQERRFNRIGESRQREVSARILAATNADLETMVRRGRFREDLFYRLDVFPIALPPLRHREGDALLLTDHFMERHCRRLGRPLLRLDAEAARALSHHPWPGNVRELENVIERAVLVAPGRECLEADDLLLSAGARRPAGPRLPAGGTDLPALLAAAERTLIGQALARANGCKATAASLLGIPRTTLSRKVERLGLLDS